MCLAGIPSVDFLSAAGNLSPSWNEITSLNYAAAWGTYFTPIIFIIGTFPNE